MGRSPCCEKVGLKKGPWTPEEDQKLLAYIEEHGHGSWRALPAKAGLQRCGKSCRLRWTNYLRPDIKRGKFSLQEEQTIIQLHALLGNRWSAIATHLPKRTDNEIKNYWNTHLKKRLTKMGIDPVTHKPKTDTLGSGSGNPKDAANLSHMAQWESARLEAEARLVRESKLLVSTTTTNNNNLLAALPHHQQLGSASSHQFIPKAAPVPPCLDVLKAWQGAWAARPTTQNNNNNNNHHSTNNMMACMMAMDDLESPTSTLNFPDHGGGGASSAGNYVAQAVGFGVESLDHQFGKCSTGLDQHDHSNTMTLQDIAFGTCTDNASAWFSTNNIDQNVTTATTVTTTAVSGLASIMEGFSDVFVYNSVDDDDDQSHSAVRGGDGEGGAGNDGGGGDGSCGAGASGIFEENKSYWNSILNLVNASPTGSPVF